MVNFAIGLIAGSALTLAAIWGLLHWLGRGKDWTSPDYGIWGDHKGRGRRA